MQFTIAQPAARICSAYHLVASSEPTGRKLTTTSVPVSLRMPTTSSVSPGAFVTTSDRYLPMPSCVMPRETVMPVFGTSANSVRVVRVRPDRVGEVLADLVRGDVERGRELDVADVVAAEVDVHQAGDELVRVGVLVELRRPGRGSWRSCRRRSSRRAPSRRGGRGRCWSRWWRPWCPFWMGRAGRRARPRAPARSRRWSSSLPGAPRPRSRASGRTACAGAAPGSSREEGSGGPWG